MKQIAGAHNFRIVDQEDFMGYRVDLIFDEGETYDEKIILDKFCKLGAKIVPEEYHWKPNEFVELSYSPRGVEFETVESERMGKVLRVVYNREDPLLDITVYRYRRAEDPILGNWAFINFSWATDRECFIKDLQGIVELSKRLGCKARTDHLRILNSENIQIATEEFLKAAGSIVNLFGTVDVEKYAEKMEEIKGAEKKSP
jgi:hypothetical protein